MGSWRDEKSADDFDQVTMSIMKKARGYAERFGEAFIVFTGSIAVRSFSDKQDAIDFARDERRYGTPKVSLKRLKL